MRTFLTQFEGIVFDLYGTLLDLGALSRLFPSYPTELFVQWRAKQLEHTFLRTLLGDYRDFWEVTAETLDLVATAHGVMLSPTERDALLQAWLTLPLFPEVSDVLFALARNHSLAILSNGTPSMIAAALEANRVSALFQSVLSADSVQRYKPAREVYALVPAALATTPDRILFCSANGFDLAGAARFGFATCWVNRLGLTPQQLDSLGYAPTVSVHALDELVR